MATAMARKREGEREEIGKGIFFALNFAISRLRVSPCIGCVLAEIDALWLF